LVNWWEISPVNGMAGRGGANRWTSSEGQNVEQRRRRERCEPTTHVKGVVRGVWDVRLLSRFPFGSARANRLRRKEDWIRDRVTGKEVR
jgi:hypothetical protein